jgi:hypothetical protein
MCARNVWRSDTGRARSSRATRLADIDDELATLRRIGERSGRSHHVEQLIADLERERASIAGPQNRTRPAIDFEALYAVAGRRPRDADDARGDAPARRAAFRSMLGDERVQVLADQEREHGCRLEGLLSIDLSPPPGLAKLVAWARSVLVPIGRVAIPFAA